MADVSSTSSSPGTAPGTATPPARSAPEGAVGAERPTGAERASRTERTARAEGATGTERARLAEGAAAMIVSMASAAVTTRMVVAAGVAASSAMSCLSEAERVPAVLGPTEPLRAEPVRVESARAVIDVVTAHRSSPSPLDGRPCGDRHGRSINATRKNVNDISLNGVSDAAGRRPSDPALRASGRAGLDWRRDECDASADVGDASQLGK